MRKMPEGLPLVTALTPTQTNKQQNNNMSPSPPHLAFSNEWRMMDAKISGGKRSGCAFVSFGDEMYFIGGMQKKNSSETVISYNRTRQEWTEHPSLPQPRSWCAAVAIGDHQLVVVGGYPSNNSKSVLLYDTETGSWSKLPDLKIGRRRHACVCVDNKVYAIGGWNPNGVKQEDTIEVLDLSSTKPAWTVVSERMKKGRSGCAAAVDFVGKVIVTGGYNDNDKPLDSLETFDTLDQVWTSTLPLPPMSTPRASHRVVAFNNGRLLLAMGGSTDKGITNTLEVLRIHNDGNPMQWIPIPPMNTPRRDFAVFAITNTTTKQGILVAGGSDEKNRLDTMEEFPVSEQDIVYWTLLNPPPLSDLSLTLASTPDTRLKEQVERWVQEIKSQRKGYERLVKKTTEDIMARTKGIKDKKAVLQRQIAQLEKEEESCNERINTLQHTANKYYSRVNESIRRANRISDVGSNHPVGLPNELLCPITQELMIDPVMAIDGHTYERAAIERVFENTPLEEGPRSPATGLQLPSRLLIPNVAIRSQCRDYSHAGGR